MICATCNDTREVFSHWKELRDGREAIYKRCLDCKEGK